MPSRSCAANVSAHASVDQRFGKAPGYIEAFTAYRAWKWTAGGVTSLNGKLWTPKVPFEATCEYRNGWKSMLASAKTEEAARFWKAKEHHCPDESCTCGMYAGIDMKHLIDTNYIQRGIHGEVHLWGRLCRHTFGWRAQYAYPKFFVVPANMVPFNFHEAKQHLKALVEFDVNIYLQPEREARVGQAMIPLWVREYGYSQQGVSFLVEKRQKWYSGEKAIHTLTVGDRVTVFTDVNGGGIGIVTEITGGDMYYTMSSPHVVYHKNIKDVAWNERNWRWETTGLGMMRKLERAMGK